MKQVAWINVLIGFWLVIAAFTQNSQMLTGVRMMVDLVAGLLILAATLWFLGTPTSPGAAFWAFIVIGGGLVFAPFLMGYGPWNDVLCGIGTVAVALVAAAGVPRRTVAP